MWFAVLTKEKKNAKSVKIPKNMINKLGAENTEEAVSNLKKLLKAIVNPAFRYSIELNEEETERFLERMRNGKPDPEFQKFLKESEEYAKKHPIRKVE